MEVKAECIPCLVDVRCREVMKVLNDSPEACEICLEVIQKFSELIKETKHTTKIATELYRLVRKRLGVDPYRGEKREANRWALEILPKALEMVNKSNDSFERFNIAVRFSLIGNAIDLGVSGYTFNLNGLNNAFQNIKLDVDDVTTAYELARRASTVLYVCDNAGEIVLDRLLVREFKRLGARVVVAVRSEPYQNDATMEEAEESGIINDADEVIAIGDCTYLAPEVLSKEALDMFKNTEFAVLKGMANYENLQNLRRIREKGYFLLLRAKCNPIAKSLKIDRGGYVAKVIC
ncbi:MAG: ARMT1-like domain-containing protein [Candidatus Bathyarchaeia archaeon]